MKSLGLAVILSLGTASYAVAEEPPYLGEVFKNVFLDPTTYVPAPIVYSAYRTDWDSSQVFFQHGWVEWNPRFTVSGKPYDKPVSYAEGNRRVFKDALMVFGTSVVNNFVEETVEHKLLNKYPGHRKLIHILGWTERIGAASCLTYWQSHQHFRQAHENREQARANGWTN